MNEVRRSSVDSVVVAIMAKALTVANVVTEFRVIAYGFDVVRFEPCRRSALLTFAPIAEQDGRFPREILRAATPLRILVRLHLGRPLTRRGAVGARVWPGTRTLTKLDAALSAHHVNDCAPTSDRAIDARPSNVGRRPLYLGAAPLTYDANFLGLGSGATRTRTEPLFEILRRGPARLSRDGRSARPARRQIHTVNLSKGIANGNRC